MTPVRAEPLLAESPLRQGGLHLPVERARLRKTFARRADQAPIHAAAALPLDLSGTHWPGRALSGGKAKNVNIKCQKYLQILNDFISF